MDSFSISVGAFVSVVALFLTQTKQKIDQAKELGALENRVTQLEARAKKVDEILDRVVNDIGEIKASLARLEGLLMRKTPPPR